MTKERLLTRMIARVERMLERASAVSHRFSQVRLAIFLVGVVVAIVLYRLEHFHVGNLVLLLFSLTFILVAWYHNRLEGRMQRLRIWKTIKRRHLARVLLDWQEIPQTSTPSIPTHPYATDLDLVGPRSLFTLLNTTLSCNGRDRLADWLLSQDIQAGHASQWEQRQALVKELSHLTNFRDRLALEAAVIGEGEIDGRRILTTLETPAGFSGLFPLLALQSLLALCTIMLGIGNALGWLPGYWGFSFTLYAVIYFLTSSKAAPAFSRALSLHHELEQLGAIFQFLKSRRYRSMPALARLCAPIFTGEKNPHTYIKRFARISHSLSIRAHALVHLGLNALIPWDLYWAYRLDRLQQEVLPEVPTWLAMLAELEAAVALGNFAYLNPSYTWPTMVLPGSNGQSATFKASQLGHPLIAPQQRVTNEAELQGLGRILIITGSNMSGKSTFLRTIGINICLAQAGAPVCASAFQASWVRLHCCIRVDDSLEEGLSFFYAEVKRLKRLLDAAQDSSTVPVLFLIDEIFKGTNNRERVIGSKAFIQSLANSNGLGLVTTHDLELAELEKDIPTASNAHFREGVENNALTFDYQLRQGPCPTTNALRIMALEGLPVPENFS